MLETTLTEGRVVETVTSIIAAVMTARDLDPGRIEPLARLKVATRHPRSRKRSTRASPSPRLPPLITATGRSGFSGGIFPGPLMPSVP